jgi:hypothetical protein
MGRGSTIFISKSNPNFFPDKIELIRNDEYGVYQHDGNKKIGKPQMPGVSWRNSLLFIFPLAQAQADRRSKRHRHSGQNINQDECFAPPHVAQHYFYVARNHG